MLSFKSRYFADNLRTLRTTANLTQQELGEQLNYSGKAVSKWESGDVIPPVEVIFKIADLFQTDLNSLFFSTESPAYFLGVDGGGTSTEFVLVDKDDAIIGQCTLGPCNILNMSDADINTILTDGISRTCSDIPLGQVSAFFGIAGAAGMNSGNKLASILNRFGFAQFSYGADAQNSISSGLYGRDGLITILGTGSVVFCSIGNEVIRYGGYGHLLGDYCSGYEISRCALSAVLAAADGSGPKTLLTELFEKKCNAPIFEMLPVFYQQSKSYIASFAPLVFEAYKKGDAVAKTIVVDNVAKLCTQITAALKNFDEQAVIPLVISGGLTFSSDILLPLIREHIARDTVVVELLADRPVMGAVRLAKLLGGERSD